MTLDTYRQKRRFNQTPEPEGGPTKSAPRLRFVIQEHHATRLHWDFRLEMGGTLKSWAVPKGPTLDPGEKRLAVPVEDHPIEYMEFEGVIPKGNYGAGTVMVWDHGTYDSLEGPPEQGYEKGKLTVVLHGEKLRGEFHLVRTRMGRETQWLMFKKRDADAVPGWKSPEPSVSVKTGRTIPQIAGQETHRWQSAAGPERPAATRSDPTERKRGGRRSPKGTPKNRPQLRTLRLDKPGKDPFPADVKPTLATLTETPFDDPRWLFEVKWDGIRAISYVRRVGSERQVTIRSRGGHVINEQFPEMVDALYDLDLPDALLDGEIVALDPSGRSSFPLLQQRGTLKGAAQPPLAYYVFDLLYVNGHDLTARPLRQRREALVALLTEHPLVRVSDAVPEEGRAFYAAARDLGIEGIVGKRADSPYQPGKRTGDWVKLKVTQELDAVIGGFTRGQGARAKTFGAVLVGAYDGGRLRYIGHCGGGFTDTELTRVYKQLKEHVQDACPFDTVPPSNEKVTWVRPDLVTRIVYGGWTRDGMLRFPVYAGLRDDKRADEVKLERPSPPPSGNGQGQPKPPATPLKGVKPAKARKLHPLEQALEEAGLRVELTNLDKVFWPEAGYTKGDLIEYYLRVGPVMLPHLRDRPVTLRRFPNGIAGEFFYQKDVPDAPPFVTIVPIASGSTGSTMAAPVCNNLETLLWLAQLADIEIHTWFSRTTPLARAEKAGRAGREFAASPEALRESVLNRPDYVAFDIDPYLFPDNKLPQRKGEKDPDYSRRGFEAAREAAFLVRDVLKTLKLESFVKASGKTGLHVFVPIVRAYTFEQVHEFAKTVTQYLEGRYPRKLTTAWAAEKRVGKVFLDYNQNRLGATLAGPYSIRPTPQASVALPVTWKEVEQGFDPLDFTLRTVPALMKKRKDAWRDLLARPQRLEQHL